MDIYKSLNINIGIVMRFPEMLIFVPDHVQTNKMCKNAVKKLPSVIRYVPDRYKAQHYIGKDCIKTFCTSLRDTQKIKIIEKLRTIVILHANIEMQHIVFVI